jgi:hypothetical protein
MAWEISWVEGTREQLEAAARKMYPTFPGPRDVGCLVVEKVEEEIRLHPLPAPELAQFSGEEIFKCGPVQVFYQIDSGIHRAHITKVDTKVESA